MESVTAAGRINHRLPSAERQAVLHPRALQYVHAYQQVGTWNAVAVLFDVSLGRVQHTMKHGCPPALFIGTEQQKPCAHCGTPFPASRVVDRFCSRQCRDKARTMEQGKRRRSLRIAAASRPGPELLAIAHEARAEIEAALGSKGVCR